ncbi:MAG TPA: hypothetical protein PKD27_01720 [Tepidiformaceae bacterium]|nr:hypothetical protein [Tepidiformaceae bacterium]
MKPDEFVFEVDRAEWLFTVALGLGLGLVVAAAVLVFWRPKGSFRLALALGVGGTIFLALTGTLAVDAAPWNRIDLPLRPYLSSAAFTAAMAGALLLGMLLTCGISILGIYALLRRRLPAAAVLAWPIAAVLVLLVAIVPVIERSAEGPRHPDGTDTSRTVDGMAVFEGIDIPTGLDVAVNGDILIVELSGARLLVLEPQGNAYRAGREIPLGLAPGELAFHGVFHPEYPAESFAYVVAQHWMAPCGPTRS